MLGISWDKNSVRFGSLEVVWFCFSIKICSLFWYRKCEYGVFRGLFNTEKLVYEVRAWSLVLEFWGLSGYTKPSVLSVFLITCPAGMLSWIQTFCGRYRSSSGCNTISSLKNFFNFSIAVIFFFLNFWCELFSFCN